MKLRLIRPSRSLGTALIAVGSLPLILGSLTLAACEDDGPSGSRSPSELDASSVGSTSDPPSLLDPDDLDGPDDDTRDGGRGEHPDRDAGAQPDLDANLVALRDGAVEAGLAVSPDASLVAAPDAGGLDSGGPPGPDASVADASVDDAGRPDAGALDAGVLSLRSRLCGERTIWPSPLPHAEARAASRVGSESFGFVEGPVWVDGLGALLFSDMNFAGDNSQGPPAQIRRLTPPDSFDVYEPSSGSNGLALLDATTLLAATHDTRSLSYFDLATGARTNLSVSYGGKTFNSPNDLAIRDDGTVYFTDPDHQLGPRTRQMQSTGVYRFNLPSTASSAVQAASVESTLRQPNGIALSPDQTTLYIGSAEDEVWRYDLTPDGVVRNRMLFAQVGGSDGLTIDCAGNLYVTSGTVEVFAPNGAKLGDIAVAETPSNVAFGGADHRTLYITARQGLYEIALGVPGWPY